MTPTEILPPSPSNRQKAGFSLIEVCMALAIVAIVFVTLVGLLPTGMKVFEDASATTAQPRIVSHMVGMLQGTDYTKFKGSIYNFAQYYYDVDGGFVDSSAEPEANSELRRVYVAKIVDSTQNIPNNGTYDATNTASRVLILMGRNESSIVSQINAANTPTLVNLLIKAGSRVKVQPVIIVRMDAEKIP